MGKKGNHGWDGDRVHESLLAKALDALPNPVFLYDRDLRVQHANAAALRLWEEQEVGNAVVLRGGEALRCVNARRGPGGCGTSPACATCAYRGAILEAIVTQTRVHQDVRLQRETPSGIESLHLRVLALPFDNRGEVLALVELIDVSELVELRGLLGVCGRCGHPGTNDAALRERIADYFATHSGAVGDALCDACCARP